MRDLCEKDFAGTLKAAKAMGFEGVETGRFYGLDAKGLKAACDEAGLELVYTPGNRVACAFPVFAHCHAGTLTEKLLRESV